uniref:Uncharacterized protein n=1 Tax=Arundo donax TaxID=35708 RepID=A0A0A8Z0H7_ARUDO
MWFQLRAWPWTVAKFKPYGIG